MTIAPLIFSSFATFLAIRYETKIEQFGLIEWLLVTIICCFTSAVSLTPPTFLALVFGYFLGWKSFLPSIILNLGAILLINLLVRQLDKQKMIQYLSENERVRQLLEGLRHNEFKLIFFTKLSPVLPFGLVNLIFSLSGSSLKNILWGGFWGMIPRTILAIWTGSQAKEIQRLLENPHEGNLAKIVLILLIISSLAGIFYVINKSLTNKKKP